jgi:hypothetical protein
VAEQVLIDMCELSLEKQDGEIHYLLLELLSLIKLCRKVGINAIWSEIDNIRIKSQQIFSRRKGGKQLEASLEKWTTLSTSREQYTYLSKHPELLDHQSDTILVNLFQFADEESVLPLLACLQWINIARVEGIDKGYEAFLNMME